MRLSDRLIRESKRRRHGNRFPVNPPKNRTRSWFGKRNTAHNPVKTDVQKGDLLIASFSLLDPNFQHTVVLLCEHSDSDGSFGLVLNRPIPVPPKLEDQLGFADGRLYVGGPVRQDALQVLHRGAGQAVGGVEVVPGVWIGGDVAAIQKRIETEETENCRQDYRFFLGYSGWGEGQLAGELTTGSWMTVHATADLVFFDNVEKHWLAAVRARGRKEPMLANYPEDPRWN